MRKTWIALLACGGCTGKNVELGDTGTPDVEALCSEQAPTATTLRVTFPEYTGECGWGENGNLDMEDAHVTARVEDTQALSLGDDTVICDVDYDFQVDPEHAQIMQYDDNFILTFDDAVLATSYAPFVDEFAEDDGLPIYSWDAIAGMEFSFDTNIPTWCLGEADGLATCTIPPPETPGEMALDFDSSIVTKLSYRSIALDRVDFTFVTIGDNDAATDCSHNTFEFDVTVSYVTD